MNGNEKVLVEVPISEINYLVPAKLLGAHSTWFSGQINEREGDDSIVFTASAHVLECVLVFICTGVLRMPRHQENEPEATFKMATVACWLKMEDLEWCAVGRLEEYFEANKSIFLPQNAVEYVLKNTESTSHLREWLADHVAGCLSTRTMCAGALYGVVATAPDFAAKIMMSMQETAIEITTVLLGADVSDIERARSEVIHGGDYEGYYERHWGIDEQMESGENEDEEADPDLEDTEENTDSGDNDEASSEEEDDGYEEESSDETDNSDEEENSEEEDDSNDGEGSEQNNSNDMKMVSSAEMMGETIISERQPIPFARHLAVGIGGVRRQAGLQRKR
jgi:hypothetical protein